MDLKTIIALLHAVFYRACEKERRYSRVWLTEGEKEDDEVRYEDHFHIAVVLEQQIETSNWEEEKRIFHLLRQEARDVCDNYIELIFVYDYDRPRRYHLRDHYIYTAAKHELVP